VNTVHFLIFAVLLSNKLFEDKSRFKFGVSTKGKGSKMV